MRRTLFSAVVCAVFVGAGIVPAQAKQVVSETIRVVSPGGEGMPMQMLPPGRQAKTGTGSLRGRVLTIDTGSVVRRAQVRISGPDIGTKTALTDAQGRYEFRDLPAGRFNVSVSKSGFVTMAYGQTRPFEPGRPIELVDAQKMEKADVALPRGSVLAGRVADEFGEAVAEAEVTAMRLQFSNGKRRLVPSGRNGTTNDLGQFRIYGLPPGEYYVSATLRNMNTMVLDMIGGGGGLTSSNQTTGYAATYYPSTPTPSEAQRVAVAVGQELASVDIQLQPVKLAKITGSAIASDGKPMTGATVMLMPKMNDAMTFMPGGSSRTDANGNFTLSNVTPGEYSLQVQSMGGMISAAGANMMTFTFRSDGPGGPGPDASQQREFATASVNVAGEDITGMVVVGTRGAKATGTISYGAAAKPEGTTTIRITAAPVDGDAAPVPMGAATVKETGAFEVDGLVGQRVFRAVNLPKGWVVKHVKVNGEDVTDKGAEFKPGEDVTGIEIELTNRTTSINGSVTDDKNQPLKDYTVVVFAEDATKWPLPLNRWTASSRPDQEGRFKFSNLPPGAYYAIAVEYVAQGEWSDPEWLARAAKKATRFTLDEGGVKALDLKLSGS